MAQGDNVVSMHTVLEEGGEDCEHAVRSETASHKDSDIVVTGHSPHEALENRNSGGTQICPVLALLFVW